MRSSSAVAVTRAYSIANRPEDVGRAVFNIRLAVPPAGQEQEVPPGVVSSWLFARRPGDKVEASGPFGDFHVQPTQREMVFIGGGVGMAPLRAMIHEQIGAGTDRKMRFFYGARARRLICSMSMSLRRLRKRSEFHMDTGAFRSRARRPLAGATGFIHDTVRAAMSKHPAPEDCEYYLCGPPIMISAVLHTLAKLGVEPASIFNDDFGG
ncbi:FAD-binding oxidoreductase [Pseudorhodobacter turbinis]|uniref:FAD-binding oxidoreductase n=1 Tax=Pseudorhodobacter turbinis TaxID=2500533 RepID=UPI0019825D48|nr:FAD-binding oxidoreductase [Pseudorhodobacter turbinis]